MISKNEVRLLKGQLALIGLIFVSSILVAIVAATQRQWFESLLVETYPTPAANLLSRIDRLFETSNAVVLEGVPAELVPHFYEAWMQRPDAHRELARLIYHTAPEQIVARAEQTIVCGSDEQKTRALLFLRIAGDSDCLDALQRLSRWSKARRLDKLTLELESTLEKLAARPIPES